MVHDLWRGIKGGPAWVEALIVLGLTYGLMIWGYLANPDATTGGAYSDREVVGLIVWELFLMGTIGAWLYARGWTRTDLGLVVSWRELGKGFLLWLLAMGAYYVFALIIYQIPGMEGNEAATRPGFFVSLPMIVAVSVINPCFEEFFNVAYLWKRLPPQLFVGVSALLRAVVHLYQGTFGMLTVFVIGLVFAIYFKKRQSLFPLIVAHAITDFVGLYFAGRAQE
jgi:uncharacterized protein